MRLVLLVVALAACSSSVAGGPAWPRPARSEVDGGESLAPRAAAREIAAAIENAEPADPPAPEPPAVTPDDTPGAPGDDAPPAADPAAPPSDEPLVMEEIVIEIED